MSVTSTARLGLLQRNQPMLPPLRSDPVTSRLSSRCSAGMYCAARARAAANDALVPAHTHSVAATSSTVVTSASTNQPKLRQIRTERLRPFGAGRPLLEAPALKLGERMRLRGLFMGASEAKTQTQMQPQFLRLHAIRQVSLQRPYRAAPPNTGAHTHAR